MDYIRDYVEYYNGQKMPIIGLGTSQGQKEEIKAAVKTALDVGYRHLDTAFTYKNESDIGEALQEVFKEGKIKREDLFIVTKVRETAHHAGNGELLHCGNSVIHWLHNGQLPPHGIRPEHVPHFLKKQLASLKLDYVDLYLIHSCFGFKYVNDDTVFPTDEHGNSLVDPTTDLVATWKTMEEMVDLGFTRSIGVSNFCPDQIDRVLAACRIKPANIQVECHVYLQERHLFEYCKGKGITFCAFSPFGSPGSSAIFSNLGVEKKMADMLGDPVIKAISEKHNKKPSHVLLKFLTQQGMVVIPKSVTPARIKENFEIFDFQLSPEDMAGIRKLNRNFRIFDGRHRKGAEIHPEFQVRQKYNEYVASLNQN